ncbi:hypothetical protein [Curvibacter gracilis]|nr:hypothetical protein [Curvibacter gracilis]
MADLLIRQGDGLMRCHAEKRRTAWAVRRLFIKSQGKPPINGLGYL